MEHAFTLTIDWLAFTIPKASKEEVMQCVGGQWSQSETGFRGYPKCWTTIDGVRGIGKLGTGAFGRPSEVHVDLSAGVVSLWELDKVRDVLQWVIQNDGHVTRMDCALDDRSPTVTVARVKQAVETGQAVTRAERFQVVSASSVRQGTSTGDTLYFGSGQSQTLLRIYDKRLELQHKGRENWQDHGVRWELQWELQLRKDRAQACASALVSLGALDWRQYVVGVLRAYVDFRATTREASAWERGRAALLPWWEQLTEGFTQCRLHVEKEHRTLEDVKEWALESLAPMLAVLKEGTHPRWMDHLLESGKVRWKDRHRRLLGTVPPKEEKQAVPQKMYVLKKELAKSN